MATSAALDYKALDKMSTGRLTVYLGNKRFTRLQLENLREEQGPGFRNLQRRVRRILAKRGKTESWARYERRLTRRPKAHGAGLYALRALFGKETPEFYN